MDGFGNMVTVVEGVYGPRSSSVKFVSNFWLKESVGTGTVAARSKWDGSRFF